MNVLRYEKVAPVSRDFIEELIRGLDRVITPDTGMLREILILSGMPRQTENLRYMSYNRQVETGRNRVVIFSAVAVINNRRAERWQLSGTRKKLSQFIFNTRWTRNPLDLFLNNLRCNPEMISLMDAAQTDYTLLGILQESRLRGGGFLERKWFRVRPVVVIPGLFPADQYQVESFETRNEIRKVRIKGLPISPTT
jgi:hypothetical protein